MLDSLDDARNYADWIIAEMSPYLGGQILEIGAGTGTMSERLRHHGAPMHPVTRQVSLLFVT